MTNLTDNLGILIIAAGNSSRLGTNKQLVELNGVTLLERTINIAKELNDSLICVLGYDADNIKSYIHLEPDTLVVNHHWKQGMGSSIARGINYFCDKNTILFDAVMILLCDQYLINPFDLKELKKQWKINSNQKIIASQYFDPKEEKIIQGAPAIFPKEYFDQLKNLKEKGARKIIQQNQHKLISVPLENAAFDLDTKEDLEQFKTYHQKTIRSENSND